MSQLMKRTFGDRGLNDLGESPINTLHVLCKPPDEPAHRRDIQEPRIGAKDPVDEPLVDGPAGFDGAEVEEDVRGAGGD